MICLPPILSLTKKKEVYLIFWASNNTSILLEMFPYLSLSCYVYFIMTINYPYLFNYLFLNYTFRYVAWYFPYLLADWHICLLCKKAWFSFLITCLPTSSELFYIKALLCIIWRLPIYCLSSVLLLKRVVILIWLLSLCSGTYNQYIPSQTTAADGIQWVL